VPNNLRPGEHPLVLPGRVEHAEVPGPSVLVPPQRSG
jgi:hypothetical protein